MQCIVMRRVRHDWATFTFTMPTGPFPSSPLSLWASVQTDRNHFQKHVAWGGVGEGGQRHEGGQPCPCPQALSLKLGAPGGEAFSLEGISLSFGDYIGWAVLMTEVKLFLTWGDWEAQGSAWLLSQAGGKGFRKNWAGQRRKTQVVLWSRIPHSVWWLHWQILYSSL